MASYCPAATIVASETTKVFFALKFLLSVFGMLEMRNCTKYAGRTKLKVGK